ncbi:MAG TPA: hypothetical protein VFT29_11260 [Gemmatimonadaceae bacterium]|nr:hypothetical protein [Gemmatimonadaceae bacterium]
MIQATLSTIALIGAVFAAADTTPAEPCASTARKPGASPQAFLVSQTRSRDTLVSVAVCVMLPKASAAKVGSYHGELYFDSTTTTVARVEKQSSSGIRVENATLAGRVNFAGAAPSGFPAGPLVSVVLRTRPGAAPRVRLKMIELNATDGTSLMKALVTSSEP